MESPRWPPPPSTDLVALVPEHLAEAHRDVTCSLLETFVEALMGAEVDAICGAGYRRPSRERTNRPNGFSTVDAVVGQYRSPLHRASRSCLGRYWT